MNRWKPIVDQWRSWARDNGARFHLENPPREGLDAFVAALCMEDFIQHHFVIQEVWERPSREEWDFERDHRTLLRRLQDALNSRIRDLSAPRRRARSNQNKQHQDQQGAAAGNRPPTSPLEDESPLIAKFRSTCQCCGNTTHEGQALWWVGSGSGLTRHQGCRPTETYLVRCAMRRWARQEAPRKRDLLAIDEALVVARRRPEALKHLWRGFRRLLIDQGKLKPKPAKTDSEPTEAKEDDGRVECKVCGGRYKRKKNGLPRGHGGQPGSYCRSPREET